MTIVALVAGRRFTWRRETSAFVLIAVVIVALFTVLAFVLRRRTAPHRGSGTSLQGSDQPATQIDPRLVQKPRW